MPVAEGEPRTGFVHALIVNVFASDGSTEVIVKLTVSEKCEFKAIKRLNGETVTGKRGLPRCVPAGSPIAVILSPELVYATLRLLCFVVSTLNVDML